MSNEFATDGALSHELSKRDSEAGRYSPLQSASAGRTAVERRNSNMRALGLMFLLSMIYRALVSVKLLVEDLLSRERPELAIVCLLDEM